MSGEVDLQTAPGRYVIKETEGIDGWPYYWHAYIGDVRVNGGIAQSYDGAAIEAKRVIALSRRRDFLENHYYDDETGRWLRKGTLPPVD